MSTRSLDRGHDVLKLAAVQSARMGLASVPLAPATAKGRPTHRPVWRYGPSSDVGLRPSYVVNDLA